MSILNMLLIGLGLGAVYGLLAAAMGITWQTSRVVDLAVGAYAAVGGMIAAEIGLPWGIPAGIVTATALGWLMGLIYLALQSRGSSDTISAAFASIGLLFASTSFVLWFFGTNPQRLDLLSGVWRWDGLFITKQSGFNILFACFAVALIALIFRRTTLGHLLTASAISARSAELTGIPVKRLQLSSFAASGLVAGLAGILLAFTRGISYDLGLAMTLAAFGALIVLGARTTTTIFLGGVMLGVVEAIAMGYLPSSYGSMAPLLVILATLMAGRFGSEAGVRP